MTVNRNSSRPTINLCVLSGTIQRGPEWRTLADGRAVTTFDLKTSADESRSQVLRVSWMNAPTVAQDFDTGHEVLVLGKVRTYWAGRPVMDVSCTDVVPLSKINKVRRQLTNAMAGLQEACP